MVVLGKIRMGRIDRIEGEALETHIYPDAGLPAWAWHVKVRSENGSVEDYAKLTQYQSKPGAEAGLKRWLKTRSTHGMVLMRNGRGKGGASERLPATRPR